MFAEVELEKDLLKNSGLSYKYCFHRKGNQSQEPEFIFQTFFPYRNKYRVLKVPVCLGNCFFVSLTLFYTPLMNLVYSIYNLGNK